MFVVYQWVKDEGEWGHKYFKNKENAEEYVLKYRERSNDNVKLEEIETED